MPACETRTIPNAWYREPWPWLLIAGPLLVVIASVITFSLALSSEDGLVADDYYKQGLAINKTLHREDVARAAGLRGDLAIDSNNRQARITLTGALPAARSLRLYIVHPTRGNADQTIDLQPVGDGGYLGMMQQAITGRRHLIIEDELATWRIHGQLAGGRAERVALDAGEGR